MIDYQVVKEETVGKLAVLVRELMADGWQPIGGVVCDTLYRMETRYLQAMVKL